MEIRKDCLVLHGGVDISPHYYHQRVGEWTQKPNDGRDAMEFRAVTDAIANKMPIVGICRGAQLLCIAAGGSLWQHSLGHNQSHGLEFSFDGETGYIKEAAAGHHQIMNTHGTDGKVLAWCPFPTRVYYESGEYTTLGKAPEIVWFPSINAVGIQAHPEWEAKDSHFVQIVRKVLESKLGVRGVF